MSCYTPEFLVNIKKAITGLYDRDKRLKINGENFWIIEKDISERLEGQRYSEITQAISH